MKPSATEATLRRWLDEGTDDAWSQIVTAVTPWLRSVVLPLLRSPDEADDVVQRVLVTLWKAHGSIEQSVLGWLRVTARNEALDHLKSPHRKRTQSLSETGWESPNPSGVEQVAVAALTSAQLLTALSAVSEELRETFLLRVLQGFSYPQIARLQDITVGAAKMRVLRARATIRAAFPTTE